MKKNKNGFSILLAMGLVLIIGVLSLSILEYIIPFGRDIKGVENSSKAFYQANSAIEEAIFKVYERNSGDSRDFMDEFSETNFTEMIDKKYFTNSSGTILPPSGEGNSDFDKNYNRISSGDPIQLSIGNNFLNGTELKVAFKVPDIISGTLSGSSTPPYLPIINWLLSSNNNTLNSSGSLITANKISNGDETTLNNSNGVDLYGSGFTFGEFYNNNCNDTGSGCSLKLSVVNELKTTDLVVIPYLEWKIESGNSIPLRYTKIESSGKSYGYKRDLEIKIPSNTVNQALDFTIFQ